MWPDVSIALGPSALPCAAVHRSCKGQPWQGRARGRSFTWGGGAACLPACLPASQGKGSGWWRYEWWAVWFPSRMVWTHFDGFPNAVQPSIHWNISLDYSFNVPNYTIHSETFSMVIQLHWTAIFNKLALNYSFLMDLQVFDCSDHSEEGIR